MVAAVIAALVVIEAVVAAVVAPFITAFIIVTCWAIGSRGLGDVFSMVLIGLLSIGILIGHLEHLTDHCRWLPIEFPSKLIMVIQPTDKGSDDLGFKDVWNAIPYFREVSDVAPEEFASFLVYPCQVMLCLWPFTCSLVIFNGHPLKIIPRIDSICSQICEPVHCGGFEHDCQIICHHIGVSAIGSHSDSIANKPLLGVSVTVIWIDPRDLKVGRPLDSLQPYCEGSWTIDITDDDGVTNGWRSGSIGGSWSNRGAGSRPGGLIGGWCSGIARVSQLNWLKSSVGVALFLVVFLSVKDLLRMARIATPFNVTMNIMEAVEMPMNVATRLVSATVQLRDLQYL